MPDIGITVMQDAETGEQLLIDTHDPKFRRRFIEAAHRRRYELNVTFNRLGVDVLALSTGDDLVKEIVRFAVLRKRLKKAPASFHLPLLSFRTPTRTSQT